MQVLKLSIVAVTACMIAAPVAMAQSGGGADTKERAMPAAGPDSKMKSERAMEGGAQKPAAATSSSEGKSERAEPDTNKADGK